MGIASLWIVPYRLAAEAAFYMEITGRSQLRYGSQTSGPEC